MSTSGTATWNLDITDLIEEAYERAGGEMRTAYDYRTARRSLNVLAAEWSNRGLNLWTVTEGSIPLVAGTATYSLPSDCIDVIESVVRSGTGTTQSDMSISRINVSTYAAIPSKNSQGRPVQVYVDRQNSPSVTVWPVPDQSYTYQFWYMRRIQDATNAVDAMDLPVRFVPALIAGLAFHISMKKPELATRAPMLKQYYEEQFSLAAAEDRDRSSISFTPHIWYGV